MNEHANYIKGELDKRTLHEQLAEECNELAKASLKMIRAYEWSNNVTPVTHKEALKNWIEEFKDVLSVATLILNEETVVCIANNIGNYPKYERWAKRLKERKDNE